jgi:signal transduction histidine kinase/CheY-like chemotaxis protein
VNGSIISENRQAKSTSEYRTTSEILRRQQQVAREVSIILVSAIAIWIVEYNFDLYGSLREWERRMGLRWLDETLVMSTFLGLAFAFFSYRRWKDVQAEIQERQKAEAALHQLNLELEHANRTKDEFLANMSHELRTPLNSILGMSEILLEQKRDPLSDYQNRSIQLIESSGQHLLALINDVLDLSKIEAGKLDFYPEIVDLPELIRISLAFTSGPASKKSISLTHKELRQELQQELKQELQPITRIFADPRRLKQILINLLINAVKFTPEGGQVTLQVRGNAEENLIQFCVTDTGIGIAREDMDGLFRPFVQVDSRLNRQYEGTGLGLALVQKFTDLHGGSIHVESEVGKGSQFTIHIPWGIDIIAQEESSELSKEGSATRQVEKNHNDTQTSLQRGVILLAEDNKVSIMLIRDYLESHEFEVVVAHNGLEALEKAEAKSPDVVLMDVQMPAMDGLEAIRRLRASSDFATTPIIALTALAMPGDRERCLDAGANEYLSKPVNLKKLLQSINEIRSRKR